MYIFFEALSKLLENLFYRFLIGLGLGFTTYQSLDALIEALKSEVISKYMSLDSNILSIIGLTKIDEAITIIFSAVLVKMALKGFVGGSTVVSSWGFGK